MRERGQEGPRWLPRGGQVTAAKALPNTATELTQARWQGLIRWGGEQAEALLGAAGELKHARALTKPPSQAQAVRGAAGGGSASYPATELKHGRALSKPPSQAQAVRGASGGGSASYPATELKHARALTKPPSQAQAVRGAAGGGSASYPATELKHARALSTPPSQAQAVCGAAGGGGASGQSAAVSSRRLPAGFAHSARRLGRYG